MPGTSLKSVELNGRMVESGCVDCRCRGQEWPLMRLDTLVIQDSGERKICSHNKLASRGKKGEAGVCTVASREHRVGAAVEGSKPL